MRPLQSDLRGFLLLCSALFLASCSSRLGWGLLLWSAPAEGLHAGTIVPVYIRSNIEKLYVVGVPGSRKKIELPLWQVEVFRSRGAAENGRNDFGPYVTSYLFANRDGLPLRAEPANIAKRVYRLRQGQSVKILGHVNGQDVTTGGESLEGRWYRVITEDGTRGFVFSNTMRLYDELTEAPPSLAGASAGDSARRVDFVFSKVWRAEYFQEMMDEGRVDLDLVSLRFGLFADSVRRQIRIELPMISEVFNYSSIAQDGSDFVFEGSRLRVRLDGDRRLVADWSGQAGNVDTSKVPAFAFSSSDKASGPARPNPPPMAPSPSSPLTPPPSSATTVSPPLPAPGLPPAATVPTTDSASIAPTAGGPIPDSSSSISSEAAGAVSSGITLPSASATSAVFVVLGTDLRDAIRAEETREQALLDAFLAGGMKWNFVPPLSSSSPFAETRVGEAASAPSTILLPSRLTISRSKRFTWAGIEAVPPAYLPSDLGAIEEGTASGEATVRVQIGPALTGQWEGILSLRFDGTKAWADLLYRHEGRELIFVSVAAGSVRNLQAESASKMPPLVFEPAS